MDARILGPLEVHVDGEQVVLGGPRDRKLLAVLLLNPNLMVPSSSLYSAIWEDPPPTARQQIYNVIASLRRAFQAWPTGLKIVTSQAGYQLLIPEHDLDLIRFQLHVRQAKSAESNGHDSDAVKLLTDGLALWRGPLLAGLDGTYIAGAAHRLDEERLAATEKLIELRLQAGESAALIGDLVGLVADNPLRESLRQLLILALYRAGRQADALTEYDRTRRLLADELGLDPTPELRRLHEGILSGREGVGTGGPGTAGVVPPRPDSGGVSDEPLSIAPASRCFLPYRTKDFSGRVAEISNLMREARGEEVSTLVISAIDGMGGVGKTALAVHLAHELIQDYPDGQYFVDLQGFSHERDPVTAEVALDMLLLDSGVPAELVPADLTRKSARWRAQVAGKRILLLLDNALDASNVGPLIPGAPGIMVIVTSRRKLPGIEGAGRLSLNVLPTGDAVLLFTKVLGREIKVAERIHAEEVVTLCGHLPLAIRIAAARLRDRQSWRVSDLAELLRDHRRRISFLTVGDRSVQTVLNLSYRCLQPTHQLLFRRLSLHPGPDFDQYVAAALAGLDLDDAETSLEQLFDDNLLLQPAPGRYRFHDLVRDCATSLLNESDDASSIEAARSSLLDYYVRSANNWSAPLALEQFRFEPAVTYEPRHVIGCTSHQESLDQLRKEQRNLISAAEFAVANDRHDHAWQLVCSLQPLFKMNNYGGNALEMFLGALRSSRIVGNLKAESMSLDGAARTFASRRQNAEAGRFAAEAIGISRKLGDRPAELYQLIIAGIAKMRGCLLEEAYACFEQAVELAVDTSDDLAVLALENNIGVLCIDLGRYGEALDRFQRVLDVHRSAGDGAAEAAAWANRGLVLHRIRRYVDAAESLTIAIELASVHQDSDVEATARYGQSLAMRSIGRFDDSIAHGRSALAVARSAHLIEMECDALTAIGDTFLSTGDLRHARDTYQNANALADQHGLILCRGRIQEGLAHIHYAEGDLPSARAAWEHCLELYPKGAGELERVERHLDGLNDGDTVCVRCEVLVDDAAGFPV